MTFITLEHLRIINRAKTRRDRTQAAFEVGVWAAITLAMPLLRALASTRWGL